MLTKLAVVYDRMKEQEHLPVFSEAAAQVCLSVLSPLFFLPSIWVGTMSEISGLLCSGCQCRSHHSLSLAAGCSVTRYETAEKSQTCMNALAVCICFILCF